MCDDVHGVRESTTCWLMGLTGMGRIGCDVNFGGPVGNFLVCLCVWVLHGRRLVALDTTDTWSY